MTLERYQELEFVGRLNLPRMKRVGGGNLNFACVFCESPQGRKRRGYILINRSDNIIFYCHNCNRSMNLKSFLKETNLYLYEEYTKLEKEQYIKKLKDGKIRQKREKQDRDFKKSEVNYEKFPTEYFKPIAQNVQGIRYLRKRKIPNKRFKEIFFCLPKENIPNELKVFQGMVIFPFIARDKGIYGWQGRSIKEKFFSTYVSEESPKVYNLFNVDDSKRVYVFESIIDSLFVDNSIAILGSDIDKSLIEHFKDLVFVFDNDRAGVLKSIKYLELGYPVMYWPESLKSKDVNEMVLNKDFGDIPMVDVINNNLISGIYGITKMKLRGVKKK